MTLTMILLLVCYISFMIFYARGVIIRIFKKELKEVEKYRQTLKKMNKKKQSLVDRKTDLENETLEIFTLYEMTKEITKTYTEEEAFDVFRDKMKEYISFEECLFFAPVSEELVEVKKSKDYVVVPLKDKKQNVGEVAVSGMKQEDKEKLTILTQQFALALKRVKLYQEIERIAITDSLTEVYTRNYTLERFQEEIIRSKKRQAVCSLLMLDVDHFKTLNDRYGHLTGDQILREVGFIIKGNIREIDIAGRYGGEEFFIILPDTDREGAHFAAERIRSAAWNSLIKAYDAAVKVSVSIGVSTFPFDGKAMHELIDKADWALYRAKKLGRNRVCTFGIYEDDETV